MPEEKVNRADYSKFGTIGALPAADAGPRQPHKHECGFEFKHEICLCVVCGATKPIACPWTAMDAAPPVPQEAAPGGGSNDDSSTWQPAPATAPDEAMRVAEQKAFSIMWDEDCAQYRVNIPRYYGGKVVRLEDVAAALIRQAGSEREREAFESCAKELREHYNSDWDSTVPGAEFDAEILRILRKHLGEAERLLGGEACREK